jgi:hypothetical protein
MIGLHIFHFNISMDVVFETKIYQLVIFLLVLWCVWIPFDVRCSTSYSCSTVYLVQQPDVRYSSSRPKPMADENTVPYIRVLHWIYSSTTGLYSDWSVCCCQNLWWTCQNFAVLKSRDQNANRGKAVVWPWASKMSVGIYPTFCLRQKK